MLLLLAAGCTGNVPYRAGDKSHETAHVDGTHCNGLTRAADMPIDYVATYKLPEMIETFDDLPFTPTVKIPRHVLVRQVLERRERRTDTQ